MHLMLLGAVKSPVSCLIRFAIIFDVDKLFLSSIAINIESLAKPGIDVMPKEMTKDDETAG